MARVILFLEERSVAEVLARTLKCSGHSAVIGEVGGGVSAGESKFDVVVVEAIGAGVTAEREVARIRAVCPRTRVIVVGDETLPFSHLPLPLIAHRVQAKAALAWPFHPGEFVAAVEKAVGRKRTAGVQRATTPAGKRRTPTSQPLGT